MFLILKLSLKLLHDTFVTDKGIDPRMSQYPFVSTPWGGLLIIVLYLLFVLKFGPKWMKNRKPFSLKTIINIYNVCQVILNISILYFGRYYFIRKDFNIMCQPMNSPDDLHPYTVAVLNASFLYYLTKYFDLFDTIFFVLRKKSHQLSFLHIYHHNLILIGTYYAIRHYAGSHVTLMGLINAVIHIVMYTYYFLTSYRPTEFTNIWWKKYLTALQLIQFAILIIHFALPLFAEDCNIPKTVSFIGITQATFMFLLFSDFYIKTYLWPKKKVTIKAQ